MKVSIEVVMALYGPDETLDLETGWDALQHPWDAQKVEA